MRLFCPTEQANFGKTENKAENPQVFQPHPYGAWGCFRGSCSEEAGAEIEPIGQAQHGGCEHREMPDNELTRRRGGNNGFLRNGHDDSSMKNDSWPPIRGARIKPRDLQSNY